jgi:uncharacterized coiled-coil protein SlyX
MSDQTIEVIAGQVLDQMAAMRKLVANQTEALAGINALLKNHTQALAGHQRIIEALAGELGVPVQDVDPDAPQSPPPLN